MPDPAQRDAMMADIMRLGPRGAAEKWYQSDPGFRQFADSLSGMGPQQAFAERGLDFDQTVNQARQTFGW